MTAINSAEQAGNVEIFAGHLVTDNVSSNVDDTATTLEHAEQIISATVDLRREFLSKILKKLSILKKETSGLPRRRSSLRFNW